MTRSWPSSTASDRRTSQSQCDFALSQLSDYFMELQIAAPNPIGWVAAEESGDLGRVHFHVLVTGSTISIALNGNPKQSADSDVLVFANITPAARVPITLRKLSPVKTAIYILEDSSQESTCRAWTFLKTHSSKEPKPFLRLIYHAHCFT